jgi:hypothetical protein
MMAFGGGSSLSAGAGQTVPSKCKKLGTADAGDRQRLSSCYYLPGLTAVIRRSPSVKGKESSARNIGRAAAEIDGFGTTLRQLLSATMTPQLDNRAYPTHA